MKKTTRLLLLALLFFMGLTAWAGPRSYTQALQIAEAKAKSLGITIDNAAKAKAKALHLAATKKQADAAYYIFPFGKEKGFAIVSADDRMPEIVGYSDKGTLDETHMSSALKGYLKGYKAVTDSAKAGNKQILRKLEEYSRYKASATQSAVVVSPLLGNIAWGQGSPYNNLCPLYDGTNTAYAGCVATAVGQVMAYWKYPTELKADIPAYTTRTHKISMPAIKAGETFDWNNMLDDYTNGYTDEQANAVARFMLLCGSALKMDYADGSGADVYASQMAKYFGYDADLMVSVPRSSVSVAKWTELIDNELKAKRPLLIAGFSAESSGHEFVCDGSDGEGLYHINWGWDGWYNGYFDITILDYMEEGLGAGDIYYGFCRNEVMLIGIQPDNGVKDSPLIEVPDIIVENFKSDMPGWSTLTITRGTRAQETDSFELNVKDCFWCISTDSLMAKIGFGISDDKGGYTILTQSDVQRFNKDNYETFDFEDTLKFAPKPGTYTIYALYCKEGETTWHRCAYDDGLSPYIVTATATELTLTPESTGLTAAFEPQGELHGMEKNTFDMTIANNGGKDFIGNINVYFNTSKECPEEAASNYYLTLASQSTFTQAITLRTTTCEPGDTIFVWVKNDRDEELISAKEFIIGAIVHPVMLLVSVETNATPGDFETENAYYWDYLVKAPKVNDDCLKVRYGFKNIGTEGKIRYRIPAMDARKRDYYYKDDEAYKTIDFPADTSSVVYLEETWTPEEVNGARTMQTSIHARLIDSDDQPTMLTYLDRYYFLYMAEEDLGFDVEVENPIAYVAGKPSAVEDMQIADGLSVTAGKGAIVVRADKAGLLVVYGIDGRAAAQVAVEAGTEKSVSLPTGVYVVEGRKVVVR